MLLWSVAFWHFGALDGLFVELDGHYLNEDGKSGGFGEVYGCFWFNIGIREKKYGALEKNYGTLDQNNGGLYKLYFAVDLVLEIGEGGIGWAEGGYGVLDWKYFLDGGGGCDIFLAVGASYKPLTLYFYAYHWSCFVSADD